MFDSLLSGVNSQERQFTVYRSGDETAVESAFETHRVSVEHRDLPSGGPEPFLVIEDGGEFAGALPVSELEALLEPPIVRPGDRDDVSAGFAVLFEVLDETVFTAMDRRQLLAVSREIEDRALRVGHGQLHASFQRREAFEPQAELFQYLGDETELEISIYGVEGGSLPEISGGTYHRAPELDRYWTLAFEGCNTGTQACALVSREYSEGYDGFWTDDGDLVDEIISKYPD